MTRSPLFSLLFNLSTILLISATANAQASDPARVVSEHKTSQELFDALQRLQFHGFSGSILVGIDGEIRVACSMGLADQKAETNLTTDTLFEIGQLTQRFTAIAIHQLAERRKIRLDDKISKHLPDVPKSCKKISIQHLLDHKSGFNFELEDESKTNLSSFLQNNLREGPSRSPGSKSGDWQYGYALLAAIVEEKSGMPFSDYCQEFILEPVKMNHTFFPGENPPKGINVASGHIDSKEPRNAFAQMQGVGKFPQTGSNGIISNVFDLWSLFSARQNNLILKKRTIREIEKIPVPNYSSDWWVVMKKGATCFTSMTRLDGFSGSVHYLPKENAYIIILSNNDKVWTWNIGDILVPYAQKEEIPIIPTRLDSAMQKNVVGKYKGNGEANATIWTYNGTTHGSFWWGTGTGSPGTIGADEKGHLVFLVNYQVVPSKAKFNSKGRLIEFTVSGRTFKRE